MAVIPGDPREGLERLERKHAGNPEGRFFVPLADAYRRAGDPAGAIGLLREGLQSHPEYPSAHIVLGRCYLDLHDPEAAEEEFRYVLSLDPHNLVALGTLGELAAAEGRTAEAERWFLDLLAVDPMNDDAQAALGRLADAAPAGSAPIGMDGAAEEQAGAEFMPPPDGKTEEDGSPVTGELDQYSKDMVDLTEDDGMTAFGDEAVVTETIAALYTRQGFHDRAADVYRELIRRRGGDAHLEARLREAERLASGGAPQPEAPRGVEASAPEAGTAAGWSGPDTVGDSAQDMPAGGSSSVDPFYPLIGPVGDSTEAAGPTAGDETAAEDDALLAPAYDFAAAGGAEWLPPEVSDLSSVDEVDLAGASFEAGPAGGASSAAEASAQDEASDESFVEASGEDEPSFVAGASGEDEPSFVAEASGEDEPSFVAEASGEDEPSAGAEDESSFEEVPIGQSPFAEPDWPVPATPFSSGEAEAATDAGADRVADPDGLEDASTGDDESRGSEEAASSAPSPVVHTPPDPFADSFAGGFDGVESWFPEQVAEAPTDRGATQEQSVEGEWAAVEAPGELVVLSEQTGSPRNPSPTIGDFLRSVALWTRGTTLGEGTQPVPDYEIVPAAPEQSAEASSESGSGIDELHLAPPSTEAPGEGILDGLDWIGSEFLVEPTEPPAAPTTLPEADPLVSPFSADPYADAGFDLALGHSPPTEELRDEQGSPAAAEPSDPDDLQLTDPFDDLFPWEIPETQERAPTSTGSLDADWEFPPHDVQQPPAPEAEGTLPGSTVQSEDIDRGAAAARPDNEESRDRPSGSPVEATQQHLVTEDEQPPERTSSSSTTADDDDDLESFQAWLRSLKR